MARYNTQLEVSLYVRASDTADLPLEIYDALYYSGKFDPIYRVQGDMVLSAFYNRSGRWDSRARKIGRRLLKELTIDTKEKPRGVEIKVENLMPVFEEESSLYRDPKVRLSTKSKSSFGSFGAALESALGTLEAAEGALLKVGRLRKSEDARLVITLLEGEFDTNGMKPIHQSLLNESVRSTNTRHTWSMDLSRQKLSSGIMQSVESAFALCTR